MDKDGFQKFLEKQKVPEEKIGEAFKIVEGCERFLDGRDLTAATSGDAKNFIQKMLEDGTNTYDNFVTLLRYGYFIENNDLYISFLEPIDGGNVIEVLREKLGEEAGEDLRDEVFKDIQLPPLGMSATEKPKVAQAVMQQMEGKVDQETCKKVLTEVAHGLSTEYYDSGQREKLRDAKDIDEFLKEKRNAFIERLEKHRDEKTPFFNQEITDEVVQWIKDTPGIGSAKREGDYLIHTKIPFLAKDYLEATDDRLKRYYACHCGWARESIKSGKDEVSPTFCYCSGGFTVKPWEIAFDQKVEYEMVESALQGDDRCTFKIAIPKEELERLQD